MRIFDRHPTQWPFCRGFSRSAPVSALLVCPYSMVTRFGWWTSAAFSMGREQSEMGLNRGLTTSSG